jgi:hypothetical protein
MVKLANTLITRFLNNKQIYRLFKWAKFEDMGYIPMTTRSFLYTCRVLVSRHVTNHKMQFSFSGIKYEEKLHEFQFRLLGVRVG